MGVISATYIGGLTNPAGDPADGDNAADGDDNIRALSDCVNNSFPNITGAVTVTHTDLNTITDAVLTTDSIDELSDVDTSSTAPVTNDLMRYSGSNWVPGHPTVEDGVWSGYSGDASDFVWFSTEVINNFSGLCTVTNLTPGWRITADEKVWLSLSFGTVHSRSSSTKDTKYSTICRIRKNGTTVVASAGNGMSFDGSTTSSDADDGASVAFSGVLAATDYIELQVVATNTGDPDEMYVNVTAMQVA